MLSHVWLCNLMDCNMPGSSVLHYLPEFAQIHVHWVSDAIYPSFPLPPSSLFAFNLFQDQGLFQYVSSFPSGGQSIGASAIVLPMNIQGWFLLRLTGWISLQSKRLQGEDSPWVFSSTTIWKHQFLSTQSPLWSNSHIYTWLWKNHSFDCMDLCRQSGISAFEYAV